MNKIYYDNLISKFFYDIQNNIIERTGYFTVYRQSGLILGWTAGGDTPTFQLLTEINNQLAIRVLYPFLHDSSVLSFSPSL